MIEKRLVQWYAADAGVDLDIAEREIVLTYVLRILLDKGLLASLAFKGGTAIRKLYSTGLGRFSLDLDFTALPDALDSGVVDPETFILEVVGSLHDQTYHGLTFTIPAADYYATPDSCGAEVAYHHEWLSTGRFGLQISFRAPPLLPVKPMPLRRERYFDWLGIDPPDVPALDLHEVIGEKIRAAAQRSRVRDLYDLYQLASQRFNRDTVRRIAVVKCWETRYAFDPAAFLASLPDAKYEWSDLQRLVRRSGSVAPEEIVRGVQRGYEFLSKLTPDEAIISADPYGRERQACQRLVNSLQSE
jgi:predicted nucleotidyltransferase component of viral defense system